MTSSPRTSLVQKAEAFLQRLGRAVGTFVRDLCLAALRTIITVLVVVACSMFILRYLGFPVPGPAELLDKFGDVGRLAGILS
jgi:hypothetical protein